MKQSAKGILTALVRMGLRSFMLCVVLTLMATLLNFVKLPGYLNPGMSFSPFPIIREENFDRALTFLKEAPLRNGAKLEKWQSPIRIRYEGNPGAKDITALEQMIAGFNKIEGFPGIVLVEKDENVLLSYITREQFPEYQKRYDADADYTSFCKHFSKNSIIYKAAIVIYCEGLQGYRNSTVLHEMTHLMGFYNHTTLRDSILNEFGPVAGMSSTDFLALSMVYNPAITPAISYETLENYYRTVPVSAYSASPLTPSSRSFPVLLKIAFGFCIVLLLLQFPSEKKRGTALQAFVSLLFGIFVCIAFFWALRLWLPNELFQFFQI